MYMRNSKQANKSSTLGLWKESEDNCEIPVRKDPFAQRQLNCRNLNERKLFAVLIHSCRC